MLRFPPRHWPTAATRRTGRAPRASRPGQGPRPTRLAPRLEALEDRTVLSTLTVLNNADSGPDSLRDTLAAAASGDTVVFAPALNGTTIQLTSGELPVAKNLTITGPGANLLSVSGQDASRVFAVAEGATVTVTRLTITRGQADAGGAIDNDGVLTLRHVVLANNRSVGGLGGGAIWNEEGATLNLDHTTLSNNRAVAGAGYFDVLGGGLLNEGRSEERPAGEQCRGRRTRRP